MQKTELSVVIPVYNEIESLPPLYEQLDKSLRGVKLNYEIIFVDDGSTDGSFGVIEKLAHDPHVKAIQFRRNFGKAAALTVGFQEAEGEYILTMDADLQDDPQEIPRFLEEIEAGPFDLVSGWKYPRLDPVSKTFPSRIFNRVTSALGGVHLHDMNCGFKIYRRAVVQEIHFYGELYRYIPVLAHWKGFRIGEIKVRHHPRQFGRSKFGMSRFLRGFFDLLTVLFLTRYVRRPLHLFGMVGSTSFIAGLAISAHLTVLWFLGYRPIGDRPLLMLGVLLIIIGVQFFAIGLIAEMIISSQTSHQPGYSIRRRIK